MATNSICVSKFSQNEIAAEKTSIKSVMYFQSALEDQQICIPFLIFERVDNIIAHAACVPKSHVAFGILTKVSRWSQLSLII